MRDQNRLGRHRPVMVDAIAEMVEVRPGGRWIDGTVGDGGMTERLLEASAPDGLVMGLDWDDVALSGARTRLAEFGGRVRLIRASFADVGLFAEPHGKAAWPHWDDAPGLDGAAESAARVTGDGLAGSDDALSDSGEGVVDGMILDLGVSTRQLGTPGRGFSFMNDGPLDMRMDMRLEVTAADLVNETPERELADLVYRYGEERASRRIARTIVARRAVRPFETTLDLASAIKASGVRTTPGKHAATRTFQALRIAVNKELEQLEAFLADGWKIFRPGGRLAVLTYHSLEDRMVKEAFRRWSSLCLCPPRQPVCNCGWTAKTRLVTRRLLRPDAAEIERNPRSRSAGLRVVERLAEVG